MVGRAGGLGFVLLALGCGQAPECFYHGDCDSGFRCTADRVCVASSAGAPGVAGNGRSGAGSGGGSTRAPAGAVASSTVTLGDDATAWLRGGFGTARLVDTAAELQVWRAEDTSPEVLTMTADDGTSGMIIVFLRAPLGRLMPGAVTPVESVQVCGDGTGGGAWNYDTVSQDGTIILNNVTPNADEVEVQVTHGTQLVQARAKIPRDGR